MQIVRMKIDDCHELSELDKRCFNVPWSEKSFSEEVQNPLSVYFLAKQNGKIIGYCGFWRVQDEGQVTNIAVLPEFRGRGIASALLEKMIDECTDLARIVLEVRKSNTSAIRLYEKYDFKAVGIRKNFYRSPKEDGIIMIRGEA